MDLTHCNLGKFLVVSNFVARRLHVSTDAREPSVEIWNYLSKKLSCNFSETTASTQFRDLFHATNLR